MEEPIGPMLSSSEALNSTRFHPVDPIQSEKGVLSLAVVFGSSLSLVGLVFAFITFSLFSDLRSVSGTTMLNFLASLFLVQLLLVVGNGGIQAVDLCLTLALSLLYARLSVVCWLLAATHDLFRLVKISSGLCAFQPATLSRASCRYYLLGWGASLAPLGLALVAQLRDERQQNVEATALRLHNCWFPSHYTFIAAFLVPCVVLLAVNAYYLTRSLLILKWTAAMFANKAHQKLTRRHRLQLLLFIRVVVFMALVVSSGGVSVLFDSRIAWVIFSCASAWQGFFVALSVTCNCQVLKLYSRSLRSGQPGVNYSFGSDAAKSGSLQLLTGDPSPGNV